MSSGERKIKILLNKAGIPHKHQYSCNELVGITGIKLRFDFAIFKNEELHILVEFDGKQHSKSIKYFGGDKQFEAAKRNDALKDAFCVEKELPLVRIKYRQKFDIKDLIGEDYYD